MSDNGLERLGVDSTQGEPLQITKLAQTFATVQGEIDGMSRMPDIFEKLKTYQDTF